MMARLEARWQARGRTVIDLPEIPDDAGNPTVWYARPFTILDAKALAPFTGSDDEDGHIEIILRKAEDAEGNLLFTKADKPKLKRILEAVIIRRVSMQILVTTDLEQAEKN